MAHGVAEGTRVNGFVRKTALLTPEQVTEGWTCKKRDGKVVPFDCAKIRKALFRCFESVSKLAKAQDQEVGEAITTLVEATVEKLIKGVVNSIIGQHLDCPDVEHIQRLVIQQLWAEDFFEAAEHYQNYREEHRKKRLVRPISPETQERFDEMRKHFPTDLQAYQFMSKFSKWRETEKRRETWKETIYDRVIPWLLKLAPAGALRPDEIEMLHKGMYALQALPAMRVTQMAGPALDRCHVGAYNCAYAPVDEIFAFPEALYILMQGTGHGFSVESDYVSELPKIRKQRDMKPDTWVVEDDTEGWCNAYHELLQRLWDGSDLFLDVSKVRPKGARLKTKGGRASGPDPLLELAAFTRNVIKAKQGRYLEDTDAHRLMCFTGRIVQVGGVRRAAMISLSDIDSVGMRHIKSGEWWEGTKGLWKDGKYLSMANNSGVYDYEDGEVPVGVFMDEWNAIYKSNSGERGVFNRQAALKWSPNRRNWGKHKPGCNPCAEILLRPRQFCVSGETPLITREGLVNIGDAVGDKVEVWNGKRWSAVTVRKTGENQQLVRVKFSDGSHLDCTPEHRFSVNTANSRHTKGENVWFEVQAKNLKPRMATETFVIQHDGGEPIKEPYTLGVLVGDGHVYNEIASVDLYGDKIALPIVGTRGTTVLKPGYNVPCCRVTVGPTMVQRMQALRADDAGCWAYMFTRDRESILKFLAGWFDTDGSNTDSGGVRLYVSGKAKADMVQLLLTKCGIRSSVNLMSRAGDETNFGPRKADVWYVQVTDCGALPCHRLDVSNGHAAPMKGKYQTVVSVEYLPGLHDTFCFDEPEQHKGVFNNTLTHQCNLSIAVARPDDTEETLRQKVRIAAHFGKLQSLATNFKYIRPAWKANCEEERLLGVDITGHADCPLLRFDSPERSALLQRLTRVVEEVDIDLSARFGVNRSAASTTVKPSGDSAVFLDCASGVSPRFAQQQIRWVRESKDSPVAKYLIDAGVRHAPSPEAPEELLVFGFPKKAPEGCTLRNDMTAEQQFYNWLDWKKNWAEHSVSATIYVEPHEWPRLGMLVYEHIDHITGLSVLPKDNGSYTYPPNEELTKEEFDKFEAEFPTLNWAKLQEYETEDMTESAQTFACVGGHCS